MQEAGNGRGVGGHKEVGETATETSDYLRAAAAADGCSFAARSGLGSALKAGERRGPGPGRNVFRVKGAAVR